MYLLDQKISTCLNDLKRYIYPQRITLQTVLLESGTEWVPFPAGSRWGAYDQTFQFKVTVSIPKEFEGKSIVFNIRTGREGQWDALNPQFVISVNGAIVQGLDTNHTEINLCEAACEGEEYEISLAAYSGTGNAQAELTATLSVLDKDTEKLYYHIKVPYDVAMLLDKNDKRRIDIINYLDAALNLTDLRRVPSMEYSDSVKTAVSYLDEEFYGKFCGKEEITALCVGHTHIDVAWQWTLAQTRKKTVRSFSTVLNLMKEYPEYIFMSSQPQLYQYLKEEEPSLYEQVKKRVAEGRWEAEGAMWLEADCNLASGESLVRQILFGKTFFNREFGVDNKVLWLPDVFGYNAALPQILKKCGVDYFVTSKISWNQYNKIPYDTFVWKGIDGTEIFSYFLTASNYNASANSHITTYNADVDPNQVMGTWKRFQQKNLTEEVLVTFGHGDGGGGPTKKMLEFARRLEKGIPGCPAVKQGKAYDFLTRLEEKTKNNPKLPKWVGELYLEYHRGTYTSMGRNKKYNRKSELLYQDAEMLSVMNQTLLGADYPQKTLNSGWETILLNQFHDILPGSSIKEVYDDSKVDYERVLQSGTTVAQTAMQNISSQIKTTAPSVVVFNPLYFDRNDLTEIKIPDGYSDVQLLDNSGKELDSQLCGENILFYGKGIPAKGYQTYQIKNAPSTVKNTLSVSTSSLSNRFFDIKLDQDGNIISIYDKRAHREVIKKNERANLLQAFEDKPYRHDVWDIDIYYQEKMYLIEEAESIEVIEEGPIRGTIRIKRTFLDSTIQQDISIYNDIDRIDFKTTIDWKQHQILLKTAFPVDIQSDKASFDIQFGNVERPTHWNTSWDYARFEVCAHKWVDLSEEGYGVSLLNDCKYGHDIKESVIRLTLLKSGISPFPNADNEVHEFTYSLFPHENSWRSAGTEKMAYRLNSPVYAAFEKAHDGMLPETVSLLSTDRDNVVLETVKKAENSDAIIIRLFEAHNKRTSVTATFCKELHSVTECDLLENDIAAIDANNHSFEFEIKPYEIKTFKLKLN